MIYKQCIPRIRQEEPISTGNQRHKHTHVQSMCMSTETGSGDENDLHDRVTNFLDRNFPQIQMHGGTAVIDRLDAESGEIALRLSGACSGCGISPMTVRAIKSRLVTEIPEIETVHADAADSTDATSDPPF